MGVVLGGSPDGVRLGAVHSVVLSSHTVSVRPRTVRSVVLSSHTVSVRLRTVRSVLLVWSYSKRFPQHGLFRDQHLSGFCYALLICFQLTRHYVRDGESRLIVAVLSVSDYPNFLKKRPYLYVTLQSSDFCRFEPVLKLFLFF